MQGASLKALKDKDISALQIIQYAQKCFPSPQHSQEYTKRFSDV